MQKFHKEILIKMLKNISYTKEGASEKCVLDGVEI